MRRRKRTITVPRDVDVKQLQLDVELAQKYMPRGEFHVMMDGMRGEEARFFIEKFQEVANTIRNMPEDPDPCRLHDLQTAVLHYFYGGSDWYILSKGTVTDPYPHGFACLNGDTDMAEYGDISIEEITRIGAELDLHWKQKPMYQVKRDNLKMPVDSEEELLARETNRLGERFLGERYKELLGSEEARSANLPAFQRVADHIRAMPQTLPEGQLEQATAHLHLSAGNDHWYVLSRGSRTVYSAMCLEVKEGRRGTYKLIDLDSLIYERNTKLDLDFTPIKVSEIGTPLSAPQFTSVDVLARELSEFKDSETPSEKSPEDEEPEP